jgi:hypothetical protein
VQLQTTEDVRRLRNEIVLGSRADHPNLNRILGAIDDEDDAADGDGDFYHLFLQLYVPSAMLPRAGRAPSLVALSVVERSTFSVTGGDLFAYIESFTLRGRRMGEVRPLTLPSRWSRKREGLTRGVAYQQGECKYLTYQILQGVKVCRTRSSWVGGSDC